MDDHQSLTEISTHGDWMLCQYNVLPDGLRPPQLQLGCDCCEGPSSCDEDDCPCINSSAHGGIAPYSSTARGRLNSLLPPDAPIVECNSRCRCDPRRCHNRVVGNGTTRALRVIDTRDGRGSGLVIDEDVDRDTFIVEYAGELIKTEEAQRRWKLQKERGESNYIICIREHGSEGILRTNIDPSRIGSIARFINHSCDPNLHFRIVRVDSLVPCAALFSSRHIPKGAELSFDYGQTADDSFINQEDATDRKACLCGAANCRGYLPYDPCL